LRGSLRRETWGLRARSSVAGAAFPSRATPARRNSTGTWSPLRREKCVSCGRGERKAKRIVADLSLDKAMLQDVLQKNSGAGTEEADCAISDRPLWCRRTSSLQSCVRLHRSACHYRTYRGPQAALRQRIRDDLAGSRVRLAYRRILLLLEREGWDVDKKRFYRFYREENLGLRCKRPRRHVSAVHRNPKRPAGGPNDIWGVDFVADQLADGRRIRTLTIVDLFTRECLGIEVGFSLRAEGVVTALNNLKYDR